MKCLYFNKEWLLFSFIVLILGVTGCNIHEDLDPCYQVVLKVVNDNGEDITQAGDVSNATLFVFDENKKYLEQIEVDKDIIVNRRAIVLHNYAAGRNLEIVAWGGTCPLQQKQQLPVMNASSTIEDLKLLVKAENGEVVPPDTLYGGTKSIETNAGVSTVHEVVVEKKVSGVYVVVEGFQYIRTKAVDGYSFRVKDVPGGLTYNGDPVDDLVEYNPDNKEIIEENRLQSDTWTVAPQKPLYAEFTKADGSVEERRIDDEGNSFVPVVGKDLVIYFRYGQDGALISCRSEILPWGSGKNQHIEF